ncbi:MAG: F0F1 ATP synthase subunit alpha [Opitutales bacterium]|jgi:F-type H+/Na+-transporting ATPase subunit alpha|nr:F0F1 ATP synthase subunit alpha [Opitutales bacterium]MDP4657789.1 F0F1 ATP synthase subunit alpha [Opitutales bacterium]MDP4774693.1 F0F1 ATP synthase subunit alpha [Opitutales bacterium]MDP4786782.1 F0F1 ATP synthase subunit alpha [Opitutales bacterium]MDP4860267.1 F0F1 ATP synthase subunit alpha [Opitutales bacterium]
MSNAIDQIQKAIAGLDTRAGKSNVGTIVSLADGVASIDGLSGVMMNEMIELPGGLQGVALNLAEDTVGCVIMGDISSLKEGMEAKTTGRLLSIPVGKGLLGRVVDALGNPLDGKGPIASSERYPVEKIAPGIIPRKSVDQPMQTGIMAIDAMIPIGRGQRELIIGDRATGKTTIAIDTIINQANANRVGLASGDANFRPVYSIYVAIGTKNSSIARTIGTLEKAGAMEFTVVVAASAADNAANQVFAPFSGTAIGEWFMENGQDALIVYDDLSKHAAAYRQISLILKRPSGREAYPGDVFYLHSRLLERSARLAGKGSLTALPIIETQAGDVSAYIPTNVISITDGQVFLQTDLFNQGIRPAVSVGLSVSRVGSAAQIKAFKQVAGKVKGELANYRELAAFAQFGSDLDEKTKAILDKGDRFVELFKQPPTAPKSADIQCGIIWAMQNGFFNDMPVKSVQAAAASLQAHLETAKPAILAKIRLGNKIEKDGEAELKSACETWRRSFKA